MASPDWGTLFADSATFDRLPHHLQAAVYEEVARLEAGLRARMLARSPRIESATPANDERAIGIVEAAGMLNMTKDYLYRHWKALDVGAYRDRDGRVKFRRSAVLRYIERTARRAS